MLGLFFLPLDNKSPTDYSIIRVKCNIGVSFMINISDGSINSYLENEVDVSKLTNLKFRVKDSPFSRRQINAISESDLLIEKRKNNNEWRSFTFKEIIYLLILKELKQFNFKSNQLIDLKNCFFKLKKNDFDVVFPLMLMKIQIFIIISNDFRAHFTDLPMFSSVVSKYESYFCLDFNEIVNKFLDSLKAGRVEPTLKTLDNFLFEVIKQSKKS